MPCPIVMISCLTSNTMLWIKLVEQFKTFFLVVVFSGLLLPWLPHPRLSWGLAATTIAYPPLCPGPQALELHKGALTREKKEPVPLGRDYIPIRFFSPLGQPPLNPPLPWLESEHGKAGWIQKKGPDMSVEVLHSCMEETCWEMCQSGLIRNPTTEVYHASLIP